MRIQSQYKKLYGRVLKTEIGKYLITPRCKNILIENDVDELFAACLEHTREQHSTVVIVPGFVGDHNEALGLFIQEGFTESNWIASFVAIMVDFFQWSIANRQVLLDFSPIIEAMTELGCPEQEIAPLATLVAHKSASDPHTSNSKVVHSDSSSVRSKVTSGVTRPRLFIGSSKEGLPIAEALHASLDHDMECTVWTQNVFGLSESAIESLERQLVFSDFAVLVVTPDDTTKSRGGTKASPRDNVIFELGLFMGALGRSRTFVVKPRHKAVKIPSDLVGITMATYDDQRSDKNESAAVGKACSELKRTMSKIGTRQKSNRSENMRDDG